MKSIAYLCLSAGLLFMASCKKQIAKSEGPLSIKFNNECAGQPISYGQLNYANAAGNQYSIKLLKYYVSNVVLVKDDNSEVKLNNYDLMDAFSPAKFSTVEATAVPYGHYKIMRFYLGIDKDRNHSGAQDGDLDPLYNMIWTWSTGYLFMKHEGNFINTLGDTVAMEFHLGTDIALSSVEIPIDMTMRDGVKQLNIAFDLNKMYNNPTIDFNTQPIRHSTDANDATWIDQMKANTIDAFRFVNVQ
ncbi:MAG: MbnP family protein [Chitinophagaceae bacterium]